MTIEQLLGVLLILTVCPLMAALRPVKLKFLWQHEVGWAIGQGLLAVGLVKIFFTGVSEWHVVALMGLVVGRSFTGHPGSLWSIFAGYGLHDPLSAGLVALLSGVGVLCFRTERQSLLVVLVMMPMVTALRYPWNSSLIITMGFLSGLLYLSYDKSQKTKHTQLAAAAPGLAKLPESELKFFRSDAAVVTLDDRLLPIRVGQPAALLSELRRDGYSVPEGWLVYPGDDLETVINLADPTPQVPAIVRYSHLTNSSLTPAMDDRANRPIQVWEAKGEQELRSALIQAFDTTKAAAVILVQAKIWGVFSGSVQEVVPGYLLVASGQERFEVRSKGQISANMKTYETPDRLIQEVADLLLKIQQQPGDPYRKQIGPGFTLHWIHDGERLWIWDVQRM